MQGILAVDLLFWRDFALIGTLVSRFSFALKITAILLVANMGFSPHLAAAQDIVVNGISCPDASIIYSNRDTLIRVNPGCSGLRLPARTQPILVNGIVCPTAALSISNGGILAQVPAICGGNDNPCANAQITVTAANIQVSAPQSCLTASPTPPQTTAVTINGVRCDEARALVPSNWALEGISIAAPRTCLEPQIPVSNPNQVVAIVGCLGTSVMQANNEIMMQVPLACLVATPSDLSIASLNPTFALPGQTIILTGTGFTATLLATIGGIPVTAVALSSTAIALTIPTTLFGPQSVTVSSSGQFASSTVTIGTTSTSLTLLAVQSRKTHGSAGTFDIAVNKSEPITGRVTVEPRTGPNHLVIFQFDQPVNTLGIASVVDDSGSQLSITAPLISGSEIAMTILDVPTSKRITISLSGINGTGNAAVSMGFLQGDVNDSMSVNSSDISAVKSRAGQAVTSSNFKYDVNLSGTIDSSDISTVKLRSGSAMSGRPL